MFTLESKWSVYAATQEELKNLPSTDERVIKARYDFFEGAQAALELNCLLSDKSLTIDEAIIAMRSWFAECEKVKTEALKYTHG